APPRWPIAVVFRTRLPSSARSTRSMAQASGRSSQWSLYAARYSTLRWRCGLWTSWKVLAPMERRPLRAGVSASLASSGSEAKLGQDRVQDGDKTEADQHDAGDVLGNAERMAADNHRAR